jgi:hypothetical protein
MATAAPDPTLQLPSLPPGGRRRPKAVLVAAGGIAVAALVAAALAGAALRDDSATVPATPPTTAASTSATTVMAPPTTAAPERLTADSRLRLDGLGPVRIGMTLAEASAAAGVPIRLHPEESGGLDCTYAYSVGALDEVGFMVVAGRIVRIDVGHRPPDRVKTLSGIGKGSTEAEVLKTYAGRIKVEPHPYIRGAHNLVYVPNDAAYRSFSMIFESVDGRVIAFRSGFAEQVSWTEGCS